MKMCQLDIFQKVRKSPSMEIIGVYWPHFSSQEKYELVFLKIMAQYYALVTAELRNLSPYKNEFCTEIRHGCSALFLIIHLNAI